MMLLLAGLLAACNKTDSVLNVQKQDAGAAAGQSAAVQPAQPATAAQPGQPGVAAPATTQPAGQPAAQRVALKPGKLAVAPIIGAPLNVATPLAHRMNDDAKARGVDLAAAGENAAYVMKGYFSVLAENNQTTVLYVWDVLDASGNRLHRIQGQEKVAGAAPDSWSVVPASTMEAIADRTMQEYAAWMAANRG